MQERDRREVGAPTLSHLHQIHYLSRNLGFNTWSIVWPTKVKDKERSVIIMPGNMTTHHAPLMKAAPF